METIGLDKDDWLLGGKNLDSCDSTGSSKPSRLNGKTEGKCNDGGRVEGAGIVNGLNE